MVAKARDTVSDVASDVAAGREKLIPLAEVPGLPWLPKRDKPIHLATVYRWAGAGRRGHRLRTVRSVGGLCTTESWLWEFFEQMAPEATQGRPANRSPARRERELAAAERKLKEAGFD